MKKPIDPSLNNGFDLDIDAVSEDYLEEQSDSSGGNMTDNTAASDDDLTLNETYKEKRHHHHSSSSESGEHHHSGDGEHHHSSSHHSGSGEHHHSSSHHSSSSHSSSKKKKKMPIAAKIAIIFLAIILIFIIAVVGTFIYLEKSGKNDLTNVTTQENFEETIEYNGHTYVYNEDIVSFAFIGVDKREIEETDEIGTAGQADTDMVIAVNTKTGETNVIAIPRDTMVDVDLYSENGIFLRTETMQLCLSYAYGNGTDTSAENVVTSMSRVLYNVPISKYFVLDLDGIAPINDAIGGVTVESLYTFTDLGISEGDTIHLTGDLTETYVRQRSMDTVDASLNRTARQVQYIKAFAAQLLPAVMNDFSVIGELYNTASEYSTTNIDLSNVTYIASLVLSKGITEFSSTTLDGEMVESDDPDYADYVYAEFYPDEDSTLQTVLDVFYTQID